MSVPAGNPLFSSPRRAVVAPARSTHTAPEPPHNPSILSVLCGPCMALRTSRRSLSTGVRVLLRKRPEANQPVTEHCFELREGGCGPAAAVCAAGQLSAPDMLYCRTLYLSVDPFLRCRFNESTGVDYTQPYQLGEPLTSAGIGQVIACGQRASERGFAAGDLVLQPFDAWPWASAVSIPAAAVSRIPVALGVLAWPIHVVLARLILLRGGGSGLQSKRYGRPGAAVARPWSRSEARPNKAPTCLRLALTRGLPPPAAFRTRRGW